MKVELPILVTILLVLGFVAFAILALVAVRRGGQVQAAWRKLAGARGWRCEQPNEPGVSLRLHGRAGEVAWTCSLVHAPAVKTPRAIGKNRPLETLWHSRLPGRSLDGCLNLYDAASFRRLRGAAHSPLIDVMARASPGLAGRAFAAGIAAARAPAIQVGKEHFAIATGEAMSRFICPRWQAAFLRFASENAGPQLRVFTDGRELEIALLGSLEEGEQLERFIESCVQLAEATRQRVSSMKTD